MTKQLIIDPHLHLFALEQGDYHWLTPENPPHWPDKHLINRDYTLSDLVLSAIQQLAGFVHLEAGFDNKQPQREIAWLAQQDFTTPYKSIAFIDITLPKIDFAKQLEKLLTFSSVIGCRYILDHKAATLLNSAIVSKNLVLLADNQLIFECQLSLTDNLAVLALEKHLQQIPNLKVIINHAGLINENNTPFTQQSLEKLNDQWLVALNMLSAYSQCAIKCSGWEMVQRQYCSRWQRNIIQACLYFMGENNVMLASNFPLCTFSKTYHQLWSDYCALPFSTHIIKKLTYSNAKQWYKL